MKDLYCAVDLGGTKINIGIMTKDGEVLDNIKIPTEVEKGPNNSINNIKKNIYELLERLNLNKNNLKGIGIGSPGPIDSEKGIIVESGNLKDWKNVNLVENLSEEFEGINIKLQNDGNAAALGEYLFGFGQGCKNFIYITVSTGVGGGAIIDSKLQVGASSNGFEAGHMIINMNGRKCNCGNEGCFEAYASGTAIEKIASERIVNEESIISELSRDGKVKAEYVFEAAKRGDKLALEIVENEGYYLGIGIFNIIAMYNPEKISIGGGVSNCLDMFYDKMMDTINSMSLKPSTQICKIEKAKRGDCGLVGAGALAFYDI